ncbi:hypothetical protein DMH25_43240 [Streptomyces sp. WAC 01325]|uniref:hypothetical protein n=1 Tax=Streptomyces sp. WAC 01325 TaxID=2203202 RepID=UPI000F8796F7|nr:hypothetical protein [Streptomyces sp. WAC 01325]RSM86484.1 hypothetical protein DMH25_43240 [Streptomyces sp. WAC 01325]
MAQDYRAGKSEEEIVNQITFVLPEVEGRAAGELDLEDRLDRLSNRVADSDQSHPRFGAGTLHRRTHHQGPRRKGVSA